MCGIFAAFNTESNIDIDFLKKINDVSAHRGPDNSNFYYKENCFLGHRRLSIIDLNDRSNQPFKYNNKIIIFNGEIFNYIEIRSKLISSGYAFQTDSDTEVIIKAYDYWGKNCQSKFNGMWSFIIYDEKAKSLFVSRDRFGQKPLFYLQVNRTFYFASEIQQLAYIKKEPDFETIQKFLKEGGYDSEGKTFFSSIFEFPKAHSSTISNHDNIVSECYWDYPSDSNGDVNSNTYEEFNNILDDAVKLRTRSDVDIGILLSGGIDSTIVTDISKKYLNNKNQTIALNYSSEDSNDEQKYAKEIAENLDLNFYSCRQDTNPEKYILRLKNIVKHLGRGHSSQAIVSIDYLYEYISKKNIKVVLDGQGSDELLAGYESFHISLLLDYLINFDLKNIYFLLLSMKKTGITKSIIIWLRMILPEKVKRYGRLFYGYEKFFSNYRSNQHNIQAIKRMRSRIKQKSYLNAFLINQHRKGLENLLYYGDIVAMRSSVENRSPFVDHRLVEFTYSKNQTLKVNKGINKYVLKKNSSYQKFEKLLNRKKIGFNSEVRKSTKILMINKILNSNIFEMPIFSNRFKNYFKTEIFMSDKYESILFRIFQLYLWNDIFFNEKYNLEK